MPKKDPAIRTLVLGILTGFVLASIISIFILNLDQQNDSARNGEEILGRFFTSASTKMLGDRLSFDVYKDQEVARYVADKVRLLCWVATIPSSHYTKAVHIQNTWGRRCNILLFMSSKLDDGLPIVVLDVKDGRDHLFDKTKAAMQYVYENYITSIDWVFKTDDDTFAVVENLRLLLYKYDQSQPLYFGCRFRPFTKQGFMSGGGGYVLSKAALKLFVEEAIPKKGKCFQNGTNEGEDVQMGICLENVNVTAVDTRDGQGKGRFFPYGPEFHLFPDHHSEPYAWYWKYQYYPNSEGLDCCSDSAVSFHYIKPNELHVLNYLVYSLKPYGTSLYNRQQKSVVIHV